MKQQNGYTQVHVMIVISAVFIIAAWFGLGYIAAHFLAKVW